MKKIVIIVISLILFIGCQNLDKKGFDKETKIHSITKNIYDLNGYNINGYDKEGYKEDGYDESGYNKDGYDNLGYNKNGYDKDGYNKKGWNMEGINKETGKKYDKDGFDIDSNNPSLFHSNNGLNQDVVHTFEIYITDLEGKPLKDISLKGVLKSYTGEWKEKTFSIVSDENGKARLINTEFLFSKEDERYNMPGCLISEISKIEISSKDYYKVNKNTESIGKYGYSYKNRNKNNEFLSVYIKLTPKKTTIQAIKIEIKDIDAVPINEVLISGKINEKSIKQKTDNLGKSNIEYSDFETVDLNRYNESDTKLQFEKNGYYTNSKVFSISEKWQGKTIEKEIEMILYKQDDYFEKDFLHMEKFEGLRIKIKKFMDLILIQSFLKDASLSYRSIGIYELKGKKYIEMNFNSSLVYNSLKSNKYDIGKSLFGELVVKMLDSLVMLDDENMSGVNVKVMGFTKNFINESSSNTPIKYEFIMNKDMIRKFKDKDITSQKLLDESVILMDNERIELRLQ